MTLKVTVLLPVPCSISVCYGTGTRTSTTYGAQPSLHNNKFIWFGTGTVLVILLVKKLSQIKSKLGPFGVTPCCFDGVTPNEIEF